MKIEEHFEKMVSWFEQEIEESMAWTEADITDVRKREIAEHKAKNLVGFIMNDEPYKPW